MQSSHSDVEAGLARLLLAGVSSQQHAGVTVLRVCADHSSPPSIYYCNGAFEKLTGYSSSELLGNSWQLIHGPDTDAAAVAQVQEALDSQHACEVELLCYAKTGATFWDSISVSPIQRPYLGSHDAEPCYCGNWRCAPTTPVAKCTMCTTSHYFIVFHKDVTQRKLEEAVNLLRDQALSSLSEGITIADPNLPDFPLVYVNDAFTRMTGYSRDETVGKNCRFLQGPETDSAAIAKIRDALKQGTAVTVELVNYKKNGQKFWNLLSLTPVKDKTGRFVSCIGVQSNITELIWRKESEARLLEAKLAAETAADAKSMFLANMSHEIRTPLNGMIATAQLLLASDMTPEQRELTETIWDSGNILLGVLGDILDFSRIDHGSIQLQSEPVCLRSTVESCLDIVGAEASRKSLNLAYWIDPVFFSSNIVGDSIRIRQVLANILSNAVKFTETGEVVIKVELAPAASSKLSENGTMVHMIVKDTGIGICRESAQKLFQCFRQGQEAMSRRYGGTGLGLAISKRLAELMGGTIWLDSAPGLGCTVHFTFRANWCQEIAKTVFTDGLQLAHSPCSVSGHSNSLSLSCEEADAGGASDQTYEAWKGGVCCSCCEPIHECAVLAVRTVVIDVTHEPTASQLLQSCRLLGMEARLGDATNCSNVNKCEIAVVSVDRVPAAVKAGWKGRPIVAVGSKELLPMNVLPLVVNLSVPARHVRLANALLKSCSLLQWKDRKGLSKVSLGLDCFNLVKSWRLRKKLQNAQQQEGARFSALEVARRSSLDNSVLERAGRAQQCCWTEPSSPAIPEDAQYMSTPQATPASSAPLPSILSGITPSGISPVSPSLSSAPLPTRTCTPPVAEANLVEGILPVVRTPCPLLVPHPLAPSTACTVPSANNNTAPSAGQNCFSGGNGGVQSNGTVNGLGASGANGSDGCTASSVRADHQPAPGMRILIAEDNKVNQKVVCKVLQQVLQGCQPDIVENGMQVLRALEKKAYDLILMDIHMPEMDGLEASRKIQERYRPEDRPRIVALSADTLQALHDRCREAGIEEFISKPFRVEDLRRVMSCHRPRIMNPQAATIEARTSLDRPPATSTILAQ